MKDKHTGKKILSPLDITDKSEPEVGVQPRVRCSGCANLLKVIALEVSKHFNDENLKVNYSPAVMRFEIDGRGDIIINENGEVIGASR